MDKKMGLYKLAYYLFFNADVFYNMRRNYLSELHRERERERERERGGSFAGSVLTELH